MARLGTWMPFRAAQRELAFFLGVEVSEASVRQITEQAGAAQVQVQAQEVEALLEERPESPGGPQLQLMSLDGALIQMVNGEWKEVKTLAVGVGGLTKTNVSKGGQAAYAHLPLPKEDLAEGAQAQAKRQQERFEQWLKQQAHELKTGEADRVLAELEGLRTLMQEAGHLDALAALDKSLHYLRERGEMIRYAHFRAQGYPIGSGSVESAHILVVQSRMKQAGMRWEPSHMNSLLAMRNLACNDRWREGWVSIRQEWHQQEVTERVQRAACPSPSGASASSPPPTVLPPPEPPASAEPSPPPLFSTQQPSDHTAPAPPEPRPLCPAPTHPWRRPFIRRRSA